MLAGAFSKPAGAPLTAGKTVVRESNGRNFLGSCVHPHRPCAASVVGAAAAAELKTQRTIAAAAAVGSKRRRPDDRTPAPAPVPADPAGAGGEETKPKESRRVKRTKMDADRDPYVDADKAARTVFIGNLPLTITTRQLA